jgi:hypothetical protein
MDESPPPRIVGPPPRWTAWHSFCLLLDIAAIVLVGLLIPSRERLWIWLATMALLAAFALIVGQGVTGSWRGIFIDERNKLSLSRLQSFLWMVLVLAAIYAAAMSNIAARQPAPFAFVIPGEVWALLGIGTTSMAVAPLIRNTKATQPANEEERVHALDLLTAMRGGDDAGRMIATRGQIVVNVRPEGAQWSDLFTGEEVGNAAHLAPGKVQMFFATIILTLAYAAAIGSLFASTTPKIDALPGVDTGLVALLGISHAGYLTAKAIPQSRPA